MEVDTFDALAYGFLGDRHGTDNGACDIICDIASIGRFGFLTEQ
jgi:hypothetical protein